MKKSVQSVKNSLKFKANVKEGILTVRVGVKKYVLPVSARILSNENYIFLSFPATSELFEVKNKKLSIMDENADASNAYNELNPGRKSRRRKSSATELPAELEAALKSIPSGFKLGFDASGAPRLVKTRKRRK